MAEADAVIIDYGMGNLFSIQRVIKNLGFSATISENSQEILQAKRLILPGVGAFGDGMKNLKERGLVDPIKKFVAEGKPLLGICLGMQLLFSESEEFGLHQGLNLVEGRVERFPNPQGNEAYKIPHVGWNRLLSPSSNGHWQDSILSNLPSGVFMYFVHSFTVIPENKNVVLAQTNYGSTNFCSVLRQGNLSACQFHPEISGETGLKIFKNFLS
jgi:glutamine amidotransferase